VAYTGPLLPQVFIFAPTTLPYTVLSQTTVGTSVPTSMQHQVVVTLSNGGTQLFQQTLYVPQVALSRLTINPNIVSGSAYPELLQDGTAISTSSSAVTSPSTTALTLTIQYVAPVYGDGYTKVYSRLANLYLGIGLDANQFTDTMVARERATVNAQELAQANGQSVNQDAELGGILALGLAKYFLDADQGEAEIDGLTGAVPDYSVVASGLTTSSNTVSTSPVSGSTPNSEVQLPYQPQGLGIDLGDNTWNALPINSAETQTQYVNRMNLLGAENSSMEGLVWQELTNYNSISTVKALQLTYPGVVTITPGEYSSETDLANALSNLQVGGTGSTYGPIIDSLWNDLTDSTYHYSVTVPTAQVAIGSGSDGAANPEGAWQGVGYMVTPTTTQKQEDGCGTS
jgi:hypothetical protein